MTADPNQEPANLHRLLSDVELQLAEAIQLAGDNDRMATALEEVLDALNDLAAYLAESEPTESDDEEYDPGEETVPDEL